MKTFTVTWDFTAEAKNPTEAAKQAWEAMRAKDSIASVFVVSDEDGNQEQIDLQEVFEEEASDHEEG